MTCVKNVLPEDGRVLWTKHTAVWNKCSKLEIIWLYMFITQKMCNIKQSIWVVPFNIMPCDRRLTSVKTSNPGIELLGTCSFCIIWSFINSCLSYSNRISWRAAVPQPFWLNWKMMMRCLSPMMTKMMMMRMRMMMIMKRSWLAEIYYHLWYTPTWYLY